MQGRKEDALAEEKTSMPLHMSQVFPCPSPFDSMRGDVSNVCVCRDIPPTRMYAAVRQEAEDLWKSHCKNTPRMQNAALAAEREELRRHAQDETQREEPLRRGYEACCTRDMPLSTFLPDVGAVKWQASVSADTPMCHGCLHVKILPLQLFCSECKEKAQKLM